MKKLAILLFSLFLLTPAAEAQSRKKQPEKKHSTGKRNYDVNYQDFTGYNDQSGQEAARRRAQIRTYDSTYSFVTRHRYGGWSRPINEGTDGVMGHDELHLNERGEYRNLNSNTGVPLPANTGGRTR